jgi:hypothetical protein
MAFEQRDMSGSTFKNKKVTNANAPTLTGSAMIDGTEYWMSSWVKTDKNGDKWMSHSFKRKDEMSGAKRETSYDVDNDEIPF